MYVYVINMLFCTCVKTKNTYACIYLHLHMVSCHTIQSGVAPVLDFGIRPHPGTMIPILAQLVSISEFVDSPNIR